jgi:chromate transport protein ChrA
MNKVAGFLTLCLVVAMLRAIVVALVAALILALLWSLIRQPRETLVLLGTLALMGLANAQPLACIMALGVIGVAVVVTGRKPRKLQEDDLDQLS